MTGTKQTTTTKQNALTVDLQPLVKNLALPTLGTQDDPRTATMVHLARILDNQDPPVMNLDTATDGSFCIEYATSVKAVQEAYMEGVRLIGADGNTLNGVTIPDLNFLRQKNQTDAIAEMGFYLGATRAQTGDMSTPAKEMVQHIADERRRTLEEHCIKKTEWFVLSEPNRFRVILRNGKSIMDLSRETEESLWHLNVLEGCTPETLVILNTPTWEERWGNLANNLASQLLNIKNLVSVEFASVPKKIHGRITTTKAKFSVPSANYAAIKCFSDPALEYAQEKVDLWQESARRGGAAKAFFHKKDKRVRTRHFPLIGLDGEYLTKEKVKFWPWHNLQGEKITSQKLGEFFSLFYAHEYGRPSHWRIDGQGPTSPRIMNLPTFKEHLPKAVVKRVESTQGQSTPLRNWYIFCPDFVKNEKSEKPTPTDEPGVYIYKGTRIRLAPTRFLISK